MGRAPRANESGSNGKTWVGPLVDGDEIYHRNAHEMACSSFSGLPAKIGQVLVTLATPAAFAIAPAISAAPTAAAVAALSWRTLLARAGNIYS
jgi:hypothetical protein